MSFQGVCLTESDRLKILGSDLTASHKVLRNKVSAKK